MTAVLNAHMESTMEQTYSRPETSMWVAPVWVNQAAEYGRTVILWAQ